MAHRDPFVSLDVAPARSKPPGPTLVASSDHLPRGEHGGSVSSNVREAHVTRVTWASSVPGAPSPGWIFPRRVEHVFRNVPEVPTPAANKTFAMRSGYRVLGGRCDDRTAQCCDTQRQQRNGERGSPPWQRRPASPTR
ncbi:predicted protein [Streptomyces viridosporus ATCC 14672]|uniref:Predicted protein n=1 Tax=Streptomyces viridosporus (strain ATCC 14672 / DSM 40746 / JCM 4963 / KCTC 9882 / NRRL B-12104 / FH 1290) TaxID=566461 RepID=D5ZZB5_STRV1|nr:predicted protein [Streptomyces viridosporus ATCC 14672]